MSATSHQLSVPPERHVESRTRDVLALLDAAFRNLEYPYVLVGAAARDILMVNVHNLAPMRATLDVDIGVEVESWDSFADLKANLLADKRVEEIPKFAHRLRIKTPHSEDGILVDLIPFGGVTDSNGKIAWPHGTSTVMNVSGFSEAVSTAIPIQVDLDLIVPVISPPGLAVLKLLAWSDRRSDRDSTDFFRILSQYGNMGISDRLYDQELSILEATTFNVERAAAILLGRDSRLFSTPLTRRQLETLIGDQRLLEELVTRMPPYPSVEEDRATAEDLLPHFVRGFTS